MQRIKRIEQSTAVGKTAQLFETIQSQIDIVPNILSTIGQSSVALEGYLSFSNVLNNGELSPQLREQIALCTAGVNQCDYCASAHSLMARNAGLTEQEVVSNLACKSNDRQCQSALTFVSRILTERGNLKEEDLMDIRDAGFSEAEIVEIVANTVMNVFTNYFNHIAKNEIDFPVVSTANIKIV